MNTEESQNVELIRSYLAAVEAGATGEALARFYTSDAVQIELPNRLNPAGGRSDLARLLERAAQVPLLLQAQRYEVHSAIGNGNSVAVEATWSGVLAVPVGSLAAGATMKAHFAIFFELHEGRIRHQRNYDCFEPW